MTPPRRFSKRLVARQGREPGEPEQAAKGTTMAHRSNETKKPSLAECSETRVNKKREVVVSKASPAQKQKATAGHGTLTVAAEVSNLSSFHFFSELPIEIQQLIWGFACIIVPQSSPRIHQIAPDPTHYFQDWTRNFRLVEKAQKDIQFKILREKSSPVPSLLCVCREARRAASKEYTLWPTASRARYKGTDTYKRDGKHVYVNKEHDIFLFGESYSEYWFLDLMHISCYDEEKEFDEYNDVTLPALSGFLDQICGMRHLALEWENWQFLLVHNNCTKWLRNLPWLRDLTLVIQLQDPETYQYAAKIGMPAKFVEAVPNTIRADSARKILKWSQSMLDTLPLEYPEQTLPRLHVVALYSSDQDDNSSLADEDFAQFLHLNRMMHREWREDSE